MFDRSMECKGRRKYEAVSAPKELHRQSLYVASCAGALDLIPMLVSDPFPPLARGGVMICPP
jgi:hypothetical protein